MNIGSRITTIAALLLSTLGFLGGCQRVTQSNDSIIAQQQEQHQREGSAQVPPPAIVNWHEKRQLKMIQEKRDQMDLETYTYTKNMDGTWSYLCDSIGFGLPYDTRSNNPNHYEFVSTVNGPQTNCNYTDANNRCVHGRFEVMPQPEPNGLHIPPGAKGTWNMCKNPWNGKLTVSYQEEEVSVYEYPLPADYVKGPNPHKDYRLPVDSKK